MLFSWSPWGIVWFTLGAPRHVIYRVGGVHYLGYLTQSDGPRPTPGFAPPIGVGDLTVLAGLLIVIAGGLLARRVDGVAASLLAFTAGAAGVVVTVAVSLSMRRGNHTRLGQDLVERPAVALWLVLACSAVAVAVSAATLLSRRSYARS